MCVEFADIISIFDFNAVTVKVSKAEFFHFFVILLSLGILSTVARVASLQRVAKIPIVLCVLH